MSVDPRVCPLCGKPNDCRHGDPGADGRPCWCFYEHIPRELLEQIPEDARDRACVCQACVADWKRAHPPEKEFYENCRCGLIPEGEKADDRRGRRGLSPEFYGLPIR